MKNSSEKYFCLNYLWIFTLVYFFFFLHHHITPIAGQTVAPYNATDNIALDCGSLTTSNPALDQRIWTGDTNSSTVSRLEPLNNASTISTVIEQFPSGIDKVPYITARISYSQFTYSFRVTSGQKFIRLHFFPTSYPNFDRSKAFFSVKVGDFTLLTNFSAGLTADAHGEPTIWREFCVNIEENQRLLNVTFTPSPDSPDAYAFINGIEVVSMPTNLYYSAGGSPGVKYIGQNSQFPIENNTALEMVYRINVGGGFISPSADTGMFRTWDVQDKYLTVVGTAVLPVNTSIVLNFSQIAAYTAPDDVYKTALSMGKNATINNSYNVTWSFLVDSGFSYFLRLHFCEFQVEVQKPFDRMFEIFIANLTAEKQADVIYWSGGNGVPIYRDYIVLIGNKGNEKSQTLHIALHPGLGWKTLYSDAILNGIEIFKLSSAGNLAGANPDPTPMTPPKLAPPSPQSSSPKNNLRTILAIVGGAVSGLLVLSLLFFLIFRRRLKVNKDEASTDGTSWWGPFSITTTTKSSKTRDSTLPSDLCRYFSLAEIKAATNNFDNVFIIGVGGFGNVYKGFIDGGATSVAIKRLNPASQQGAVEFKTEIELLSQLRHVHLVSLIGYCNDDTEMILVYDYMARGTLRDHLYNTDNPPLSWNQRLQICIGAARGLHYLHSGAKHSIIHRDVKTTNILVDEKWVAKVSDFGLSKLGPTDMSKTHISTVVKGSFGYLDPEYYRRQQLTEKSDVYSFGVVLCEVLSAKPPINRTADKKPKTLVEWARQCYSHGTLDQMVDPFLKGKIAPECLQKFVEVATSCVLDNGIERPSMSDVVWSLQFALQLQETAEGDKKFDGSHIHVENDEEMPFVDDSGDVFSSIGDHVLDSRSITTVTATTTTTTNTSSDDQSFASKDSDRLISGAPFSEIMNPRGR